MADPITLTGVAIGALAVLITVGARLEYSSRSKALKEQGQNDATEANCDALCRQLWTRWNEFCLSRADESYMRNRWQLAALAAAGAVASAAALAAAAAQAAAIPLVGVIVAAILVAATIIATAAAAAATGFAVNAFDGWVGAGRNLNSTRTAFSTARTQMVDNCGEERTNACAGSLPACP